MEEVEEAAVGQVVAPELFDGRAFQEVEVSSRPEEFYYIGGRINHPGQKTFQAGITLLQAVLAAGGTPRQESRVEISRDGGDGRLVTTRHDLKQIKSGTVGDPKLQPGDRIEVVK